MLAERDAAPDFALPDQAGNEVKLSGLRGETVVLYFYPRAETPGCTTQACGVRDRRADYEAAGAREDGRHDEERDRQAHAVDRVLRDTHVVAQVVDELHGA